MSSSTPPVVRPATLDDVPEIVRLKAVLMRTGWPMPVELDDDWSRRAAAVARELVAEPDQGWFVVDADDGQRLAGCVSVAVHRHLPGPRGTGRAAYLGDMVADPRDRARGIGAVLLEHALAWARGQGAGRIELYSTASGRRLYERAGFTPDTLFEHMSRSLD